MKLIKIDPNLYTTFKPRRIIHNLTRDGIGIIDLPIAVLIPRLPETTRDILFVWILP